MGRLQEVRQKAGLTQEGLARKADLALNTIVKLEAGRAEPKLKTARAIASALNTTVEDIWPSTQINVSA